MGISGVPLNKNHIISAIHKNCGIIADAAYELACDRNAIYDWMKRDEEVNAAVEEARRKADQDRIDQNQSLKAKAYKSAHHLLDKKDCTMTIFTMKSLCNWKETVADQNITLQHIEKPYRDKPSGQ